MKQYTVILTLVVESDDAREAARTALTTLRTNTSPDASYIVFDTSTKAAVLEDTGLVHML